MKLKFSNRSQLYKIIVYCILTITLISCFFTVPFSTNSHRMMEIAAIILYCCGFLCSINNKYFYKGHEIILFILYLCWAILFVFGHSIYKPSCLYYFLIIFPALLILTRSMLCNNDLIICFDIFVVVITIIATISLFFWTFGSVLHVINATGIAPIQWGTAKHVRSYYNIYYETQTMILFGSRVIRNSSIFTEAPMASFIFIVAILINYCTKNRKIVNLILGVAILTTLSTAGIISLLLLMIDAFLRASNNAKSSMGKLLIILILVSIALISALSINYLLVTKMGTYSGQTRLRTISEQYINFVKEPIFGNGYAYSLGRNNTFFSLLEDGGVLLWGLYYIPIIYITIRAIRNKHNIIPSIVFVFIFAITVVQYSILTLFIITLCWNVMMIGTSKVGKVKYIKINKSV